MSAASLRVQKVLDSLQDAVLETLATKQQLGQFAIIYEGGKVLRIDSVEIGRRLRLIKELNGRDGDKVAVHSRSRPR